MSESEYIEELLHKAHAKGFAQEVIDEASSLIKKGIRRSESFDQAYNKYNEIYRRDNKRQSKA